MNLVSKFRVYPTEEQQDIIRDQFKIHSNIYNEVLDTLDDSDEWISKYSMQKKLTQWKKRDDNRYDEVNSKAAQQTLRRVYRAIESLKTQKSNGRDVGRLRHRNTFSSIEYNQSGFEVNDDSLYLHQIGTIDMVKHRSVAGDIKGVTIKKTLSNKWYGCVIHEVESQSEISVNEIEDENVVGIDLNVSNLLTDSDGRQLESLWEFLQDEMARVKREQKKLSRKEEGSENWKKQRIRLARAWDDLRNKRDDVLHKLSRWYVDRYDVVALEDLEVESMSQGFVNHVKEQAWRRFIDYVTYKASQAGTKVVDVDASYTSQDCSTIDCENRVEKELSDRVHDCESCGIEIDRDLNSAHNVVQKCKNKLGMGQTEVTPLDTSAPGGTRIDRIPLCNVVELGSPTLNETIRSSRVG